MSLAALKSGITEHSVQFLKRVSIPGRRRAKHHQAERSGRRRADAILIGDELERDRSAARLQRRMDFAQQPLAGGHVEMMQKVRQQRQIETAAEIDVEGAARNG